MAKKPRPAPRYIHTPPKVSIWVRAHGRLAARADRASVRRRFLNDHGVDKPRELDTHALRAEKYILRTQFLEHLADVRDHHILREAHRARDTHATLAQLEAEARGIRDQERLQLQEAKQEYAAIKQRLARDSLTALEKANLQGKLGQIETDVKSQLGIVARADAALADIETAQQEARKEFADFAQAVHNVYELTMNAYVKTAGRRLGKLGMTNYDGVLRDFTDETKRKIQELG